MGAVITELHGDVAERLLAALQRSRTNPETLQVVVLSAETGRGKTFAVQRFFDGLALDYSRYWRPGLAPAWPPDSLRHLRNKRKEVNPGPHLRTDREQPPFLWLAASGAPAEGSASVRQAPALAAQFEALLEAEVAGRRRRVEVARKLGEVVVDAALEFTPLVGRARQLAGYINTGLSILKRDMRSPLEQIRDELNDLVREYRLAVKPDVLPTILVLDDAQSIDSETLFIASGLMTKSPGSEEQLESDFRYFDTLAKQGGPTLVIATVWPHRLSGRAFADPFQDWLEEAANRGAHIERIELDDVSQSDALHLLDEWDASVVRERKSRLIQHTTVEGSDRVTPLVLAECVATLEEQRDPFTRALDVGDRVIGSLPSVPEQHAKDRIEALAEESRGAAWVLRILASFGPLVPGDAVSFIVGTESSDQAQLASDIRHTLKAHGCASKHVPSTLDRRTRWPARTGALSLDPDVQRYLGGQALAPTQDDRAKRAASEVLRSWVLQFMRGRTCGDRWFKDEQGRLLSGVASHIVSSPDACLDLRAAAQALLDPEECVVDGVSPPFLVFALSLGAQLDPTKVSACEMDLLAGIEHFGGSAVTAMGAVNMVRSNVLVHVPAVEERLISTLTRVSNSWLPALALFEMHGARSRHFEAQAVLEPFVDQDSFTKQKYVKALGSSGKIDQALKVLKAETESGNVDSELTRASLLRMKGRLGAALAICESLPQDNAAVLVTKARILCDTGELSEAVSLVAPLSSRNSVAANVHARCLRMSGDFASALEVLAWIPSGDSYADLERGLAMSRLGNDVAAVEIWMPHRSQRPFDELLATALFRLDRGSEAIVVLQSHIARSSDARRIARFLTRIDRHEVIADVLPQRFRGDAAFVSRFAQVCTHLGADEAAEQVLRRFQQKFPDQYRDAKARVSRGGLAKRPGDRSSGSQKSMSVQQSSAPDGALASRDHDSEDLSASDAPIGGSDEEPKTRPRRRRGGRRHTGRNKGTSNG